MVMVGHMREVLVTWTACTVSIIATTACASHSWGSGLVWWRAVAVHVVHRVRIVRGGVCGCVWILGARRRGMVVRGCRVRVCVVGARHDVLCCYSIRERVTKVSRK